jgi:hypothetical protein
VHGKVEQGHRLHDHIQRMYEDHRPPTMMCHDKHWKTLMLQNMEDHVMNGNRGSRDQNR